MKKLITNFTRILDNTYCIQLNSTNQKMKLNRINLRKSKSKINFIHKSKCRCHSVAALEKHMNMRRSLRREQRNTLRKFVYF